MRWLADDGLGEIAPGEIVLLESDTDPAERDEGLGLLGCQHRGPGVGRDCLLSLSKLLLNHAQVEKELGRLISQIDGLLQGSERSLSQFAAYWLAGR